MHKLVPLLIIGLSILCCFPSCKDEPFEYKLDRASAFSFKLDTFDLVTTDDVVFYLGPQVLHDYDDTFQVRYQRISLEAHGMTPSSKECWFIVDFDTHADGDAIGTYRTTYVWASLAGTISLMERSSLLLKAGSTSSA